MRSSIRDLKNHLSELLHRAEQGEEIVITSHSRPVAKLVPVTPAEAGAESRTAYITELASLHQQLQNTLKGEPLSKLLMRERRKARY